MQPEEKENSSRSIQRILKYPPTRTLSEDERQLLWKFRFSLMSEKRALMKFLRCVEWSDVQEAKQALELMGKWELIDISDALELLSPVSEIEEMAAGVNGEEDRLSLVRQTELTAQLCSITRDVRNVRGNTQKKIEKLRQLLSGLLSELTYFDEPIRSPLAPGVLITGNVPSESSIFESALHPLRLTFGTANGGTSKIIFKKGDDIRQDQLVVQMVSLMDRLLKLENLDLHLTPYKVLAIGQDEGMLEFIPSRSLAQVRGYGNAQGQGAGSGSRQQGSGGVLTRAGSLWGTSSVQASTAGAMDPVAVVEGQKRVKKLFKEIRGDQQHFVRRYELKKAQFSVRVINLNRPATR